MLNCFQLPGPRTLPTKGVWVCPLTCGRAISTQERKATGKEAIHSLSSTHVHTARNPRCILIRGHHVSSRSSAYLRCALEPEPLPNSPRTSPPRTGPAPSRRKNSSQVVASQSVKDDGRQCLHRGPGSTTLLHTAPSTCVPSLSRPFRPPSSSGPRRWRAGRRGWGRRAGPGWRGGWSGSGARATSSLRLVSSAHSQGLCLNAHPLARPGRCAPGGRCWGGRFS